MPWIFCNYFSGTVKLKERPVPEKVQCAWNYKQTLNTGVPAETGVFKICILGALIYVLKQKLLWKLHT